MEVDEADSETTNQSGAEESDAPESTAPIDNSDRFV